MQTSKQTKTNWLKWTHIYLCLHVNTHLTMVWYKTFLCVCIHVCACAYMYACIERYQAPGRVQHQKKKVIIISLLFMNACIERYQAPGRVQHKKKSYNNIIIIYECLHREVPSSWVNKTPDSSNSKCLCVYTCVCVCTTNAWNPPTHWQATPLKKKTLPTFVSRSRPLSCIRS